MRSLVLIARTLVGSLFVVSGLIKANDTLGFSYKLEKYFAEKVFDLPFLMDYALPLAVLIAIVEVSVGLCTLLGTKMKQVSWLLLLMILFFTWLTFYSAYYGVVKDCGCFGEALKLTPWESFSKNVVLLGLTLIIFFGRKRIEPNDAKDNLLILPLSILLIGFFSVGVLNMSWWFPVFFTPLIYVLVFLVQKVLGKGKAMEWTHLGIYVLFTGFFAYFTLHYLPIRDFRPYAEGKSIPEQMSVPPDQQPVYETTFIYENKSNGERIKVPQDSLGALSDDWSYKERRTELVEEGKTPTITDFEILDREGEQNVTHKLIGSENNGHRTGYIFLVVAYDLHHTDERAFEGRLKELREKAVKDGHSFYGVSKTTGDKVDRFRHEHQVMFPIFIADGVLLKTIIRSNPGLLLLKDGKVLGKWPSTALPSYGEVKKRYIESTEAN